MNLNIVYSGLRFVFLISIVILSIVAVYFTAKVTYPFIIAFAIAFMINPIVNFFEKRWKLHRALSVILTIIIILAVFSGLITILVIEAINGFIYLAEIVPGNFQTLIRYLENFFVNNILPFYNQLTTIFHNLNPAQQSTIVENIESIGSQLTVTFRNIMQSLASGISSFIVSLPNFATAFVISILATFFISKDWYRLGNKLRKLTPKKALQSGESVYAGLRRALVGFLKAQATLISITAVIVLVGLLILRVEYAITVALIIGLVELIPYLGTGLIFVPWIIYCFFTEQYFLTIGLSVLYGIVLVQRQVMEPKILSSNIGLDPLATLIALFVGFKIFGFLGLIIGPVLLVIGKTLHTAGIFSDLWSFIIGKKEEV